MMFVQRRRRRYRYWRIKSTAGSAIYCAIAEARLKDSGGTNQIPTMTGGTTSGVTITESSKETGSFDGWYIGNNVTTGGLPAVCWVSQNVPSYPEYVSIDFGSAKAIASLELVAPDSTNNIYMPTAFQLLASITGAFAGEEVTITSASGLSWTASEQKTYNF